MNKRFIFLLLLTGWLRFMTAGSPYAEEPAVLPHQNMPLGERLTYKISWLGIPVGMGELQVKEKTVLDGRDVFHVVGIVETNKVLSKIFPMHDEAHSWIDAKTLESVQFEKKIDELLLNTHEKTTFDAEKRKGRFESFKTGLKQEFNITVPVHDVLSAFFWTRRQVLVPGESVKTVLSADQKDWALEVQVLRHETLKWHERKIKTLRVEPITRVEGEEKRGKAWMNITADAEQKPIRIVYKAPMGPVVGTLL